MSHHRRLLALAFLGLAGVYLATPGAAQGATSPGAASSGAETEQPPQGLEGRSIEALRALSTEIDAKEKKRTTLEEELRKATEANDETRRATTSKAILELDKEIQELRRQFGSIASDVDIEGLDAAQRQQFDLYNELVRVLRPLVEELKDATETPREIERLRSLLEDQQRDREAIEEAIRRVESRIGDPRHSQWKSELQRSLANWKNRLRDIRSREAVTRQQLAMKQADRKSFWDSSKDFAREFFGSRGFNLLIGIGAFFAVFFGLKLLRKLISKVRPRRGKGQGLSNRLAEVLFGSLLIILSISAALLALYAVNDWLLLLMALVVLFAIGWASLQVLPQMYEQLRMLLDLGSVRQGERIVRDGIPWKIERLQLYTLLVNPKLTGGLLRIPLRDLLGQLSRPIGSGEVWFPTSRGDWVILGDGTRAEVISQSPDLVQMRELGGGLYTCRTEKFVEMNPRNLSHGFRISLKFGIDYAHQAECTTTIPDTMQEFVEKALLEIVDEDQLVSLKVEFLEAAASSLDFQVLADFDGAVARDYDRLHRAIGKMLVDSCNANGWNIPFTQITLHQAETA